MRNFLNVALVCAFFPLSTLVCAADTASVTANTVRIHHVGPLAKGPLAASNKEALDNAKAYFDKVNRSGGVAGRQIELVLLDDQQEPAIAETLATEALTKGDALAFFMPRTSPTALALQKTAGPLGVPVVAPQGGPSFMYTPDQSTFLTVRASYDTELLRAIDLQIRFGRSRYAIVAANDAFGNPLVDVATKRLAELGQKVLVEKVDNRSADINPALNSFLEKKPDVIFLICSQVCASDFVKQYKQRGGSTQFITLSNNSSNAFLKSLGSAGASVIVTQVLPIPTSKSVRLSVEYQALCAEAKLEPSYGGLLAYVGARVVVEALRRAGKKLDRASFRNALTGLKNFDLGDFSLTYGPKDLNGTDFVEETMISKDGKFLH